MGNELVPQFSSASVEYTMSLFPKRFSLGVLMKDQFSDQRAINQRHPQSTGASETPGSQRQTGLAPLDGSMHDGCFPSTITQRRRTDPFNGPRLRPVLPRTQCGFDAVSKCRRTSIGKTMHLRWSACSAERPHASRMPSRCLDQLYSSMTRASRAGHLSCPTWSSDELGTLAFTTSVSHLGWGARLRHDATGSDGDASLGLTTLLGHGGLRFPSDAV